VTDLILRSVLLVQHYMQASTLFKWISWWD